MAAVSPNRQFIGQARLVRLLLWKIGDSTDIDRCLAIAKDTGMIDANDEAFLRKCLDAEEESRSAGQETIEVTQDIVGRLRRCADKLNRADSA